MDVNWPMVGVAVAILAHAITMLFKTPKEYHGELNAEMREMKREHRVLCEQFSRMDETLRGLTKSLDALSGNFRDFTKQFYQHVRSNNRGAGPGKP